MLQKDVGQLSDDVFAFTLDNDIKVAVVEGLFGQRAHLRTAADGDDVRMEFLGLAGDLIATGRLVDQGRHHEDIDAFQVLFRVHQTGAVFEPDLALIDIGAFPLGQGSREE